MENLWQDAKYAARMLLQSRGLTLAALLTLALAIGANTAIFSFVNGVLLQPLPFPESDRLAVLSELNPEKGQGHGTVSPVSLQDFQKQSRTVTEFGAFRDWGFTLRTAEGLEPFYGAIATPSLFRVLGVKPALGRTFFDEEDQPGKNHVILLSYDLWQRRFNGDPNILGRRLEMKHRGSDQPGESFTVVGVLPADFKSPSLGDFQIWGVVSIDPDQAVAARHLRNRRVYARLQPGIRLEQARAELAGIARQIEQAYPETNRGWTVNLQRLHDTEVGQMRQVLLLFTGAAMMVLLIACANVANLLLARAAARQKEFAVRTALGAGRARLIRQLLTESVLLALLAGVGGVLLATWLLDAIVALSPTSIPRLDNVRIDARVLWFSVAVCLSSGILFGLFPALQSFRLSLVDSLKEGRRATPDRSRISSRAVLVTAEIALALVLLVGTALFGQSLVHLLRVPLGFQPEGLLTFSVFPGMEKYPKAEQIVGFYERMTEELQSLPGVQSVGNVSTIPLYGGKETVELLPEGQTEAKAGEYPVANYHNTGTGYFRAMGIPLRAGREFDERDTTGAPRVAIINETMARRLWPQANPIGRRVRLVRENLALEIVGIAGDVRRPLIDSEVEPEIYYPYRQQARWASIFVVRTSAPPETMLSAVRDRIQQLDRDVMISGMRTMEERLGRAYREPRFYLTLVGIFAGIGLVLALVGVYGVMSFIVAQRTHEIGIRMALGATRDNVLRMVLRRSLALTLIGVLSGLAAAAGLTRFLQGLLFEVSTLDGFTFGAVAVCVVAVSLAACWIPARRATRVDPMVALRYE